MGFVRGGVTAKLALVATRPRLAEDKRRKDRLFMGR